MVDGLEGEDEAVLVQEIGEECESSYGGVERVLVVWGKDNGEIEGTGDGTGAKGASRVFVKFSQELAALRVCLFSLPPLPMPFFSRLKERK